MEEQFVIICWNEWFIGMSIKGKNTKIQMIQLSSQGLANFPNCPCKREYEQIWQRAILKNNRSGSVQYIGGKRSPCFLIPTVESIKEPSASNNRNSIPDICNKKKIFSNAECSGYFKPSF